LTISERVGLVRDARSGEVRSKSANWGFGGQIRRTPGTDAPESVEIIDTVGAGDAFSSIVILGLTSGWSGERILDRALSFASAICSIRGATTGDRGFYSGWRGRWEGMGR